MDILWHDSNTLGVDCAQVRILEQANKVSFGSLLEGQNGSGLETQVRLEVLGDLTDKALEWSLADEKISALLVLADLTESYSSRSVSVRLLDTSCSRSRFASSL